MTQDLPSFFSQDVRPFQWRDMWTKQKMRRTSVMFFKRVLEVNECNRRCMSLDVFKKAGSLVAPPAVIGAYACCKKINKKIRATICEKRPKEWKINHEN